MTEEVYERPGCDWFEGTIFPECPIDEVLHHLCDLFRIHPYELDVHPSKLFNYDYIACFHKMDIYLLFRNKHEWSSERSVLDFDCRNVEGKVFDVLPNGDVFHEDRLNDKCKSTTDCHLVITGVGLRVLQSERFDFFIRSIPAEWEFIPTRVDICYDFFRPSPVIDVVDQAFRNEMSFMRGVEVEKDAPRICSKSHRENLRCIQSCAADDWYFGRRGNSSAWYFRFYDKAYEQLSKGGELAGQHDYWKRFEWECRGIAALNAFEYLVNTGIVAACAYCVQTMFRVVKSRYDSPGDNENDPVWDNFLYVFIQIDPAIKASTVNEPYTIQLFIEYSCKTMSAMNVMRCFLSTPWLFIENDDLLSSLVRICKVSKYRSLVQDCLSGRLKFTKNDIDLFGFDKTASLAFDYDYSALADLFFAKLLELK